jgi:hypothetical protein
VNSCPNGVEGEGGVTSARCVQLSRADEHSFQPCQTRVLQSQRAAAVMPGAVVTIAARALVTGARRMAAKCAARASRCVTTCTDRTPLHKRLTHSHASMHLERVGGTYESRHRVDASQFRQPAWTSVYALPHSSSHVCSSQLALATPLMHPLA